MKLNISLDICEDDHVYDIKDEIIKESAKQVINDILKDKFGCYDDSFEEKLHKEVKTILNESMGDNFRESIKQEVVSEISKKYTKSKQYKEIKNQFEIDSDEIIKSGLRNIISDIVKSEIKKFFK